MKTAQRLSSLCLRLALPCSWILACCLACTVRAADGKRQVLFDGKNMGGWRQPIGEWQVVRAVSLDPVDHTKFAFQPGQGVMVNGPKGRTGNLLSQCEHGDVEAHLEFCISKKSNSGVYFLGRYELQVYDSFGVEKDKYPGIECGGIYPRWTQQSGEYEGHSPRINASKPPGEWQTFDVIFRAPRFDAGGKKIANAMFVRVLHNGKLVHENVELTGPTRSAIYENDEAPTGPLMLQGDHGPVAYRNIWLRPMKLR